MRETTTINKQQMCANIEKRERKKEKESSIERKREEGKGKKVKTGGFQI